MTRNVQLSEPNLDNSINFDGNISDSSSGITSDSHVNDVTNAFINEPTFYIN